MMMIGEIVMDNSDWTIEKYAEHYVETLDLPPNAHGQHLSKLFGASHSIMGRMYRLYGENPTMDAIKAACIQNKKKESE